MTLLPLAFCPNPQGPVRQLGRTGLSPYRGQYSLEINRETRSQASNSPRIGHSVELTGFDPRSSTGQTETIGRSFE